MMLEGTNSSTAISWVREDLDDCLTRVRENLELFANDTSKRKPLSEVQECLEQLHLTFNTMGQVGASMLTDEMIAVGGQMLHNGNFNDKDSLAALTDAIIVLPSYLDRLEAGHEDLPILLLPTLNELRATYDETLLSEGTLFAPDLDVVIPQLGSCEAEVVALADFRPWAAKHRSEYQAGLLGWLQEQHNDERLEPLFEVCQTIYRRLGRYDLRRLWYIASEVVTGLSDASIDNDLPLRRLFARLDLTLKAMTEKGENGPLSDAVTALSRALLFYAAQARPGSPATDRLRQYFKLDELIPDREALLRARGAVTGRDAELFRSIGEAVRQELAQVKDTLDMELRTGQVEEELRAASLVSLEQLADTLTMLDLPVAAKAVQSLLPSLRNVGDAGNMDLDSPLLALAQRLLEVESILETHIQLLGEPVEETELQGPLQLPQQERLRIISTMLDEAVNSLHDVQEAVRKRLEGDQEADYEVPLGHIAGAMHMANLTEVGALTEKLERTLNAALFADSSEDSEETIDLDALTDAVAALELYLTGCRDQQANSTRYLEIMQARLEGQPEAIASGQRVAKTSIELPVLRAVQPGGGAQEALVAVDPELRAIFLEEFAAMESQLLECTTTWRENSVEDPIVADMVRCFHTLKGSGRMIGADEVGDFSWDMEQLLSAIHKNRIEADSTVHTLVHVAVAALPELKSRMLQQPSELRAIGVMAIRDSARQLVDSQAVNLGRLRDALPDHLGALVRGAPKVETTDSSLAAQTAMDPSLAQLMIGEIAQYIEEFRPFVVQVEISPAVCSLDLVRSIHNLSGTLALAPLADEALIARALEGVLEKSQHRHLPLIPRTGPLLRRCLDRFDLRLALLKEESQETFPRDDKTLLRNLEETMDNLEAIAADVSDMGAGPLEDPSDIPDLSSVGESKESTAASIEEQDLKPDTEPPVDLQAPTPVEEAAGAGLDVEDLEILEIFLEEATEVLERCDSLLYDWRSRLSDQKLVQNLQREIHTFKGGARMAGLETLGDLSHTMESLLEQIAGNRLQATIAAV